MKIISSALSRYGKTLPGGGGEGRNGRRTWTERYWRAATQKWRRRRRKMRKKARRIRTISLRSTTYADNRRSLTVGCRHRRLAIGQRRRRRYVVGVERKKKNKNVYNNIPNIKTLCGKHTLTGGRASTVPRPYLTAHVQVVYALRTRRRVK